MKSFTDPRWLFIVNTLPFLLLLLFGYQQFTLIESLLEPENVSAWTSVGLATCGLMLIVAATGGFLSARRQALTLPVLAVLFAVTVGLGWYYSESLGDMIPWNIPRWLQDDNLVTYQLTAFMPTLAFCVMSAVYGLTNERGDQKVWPNFAGAAIIPIFIYLLVTGVIPVANNITRIIPEHLFVIGFVALTTLFLFLLLRGFFLLLRERTGWLSEYRYLWLVPLAILFPLMGLALNNGLIFEESLKANYAFGNFSHTLFYLIAGLNGLLLCLPAYEAKLYRLFVFLGRAVGLAYIAYFFLVFLPYLPLSLIAIVIFGLGFLMLTPLLLFPVQVSLLYADFQYLRQHFDKAFLWVTGVLAFLALPIMVTLNYVADEAALDQALDYLYAPNEVDNLPVNTDRLERVLQKIESQKSRNNLSDWSRETPFLGAYYRSIVLDNLMLSDFKINELREVFFASGSYMSRRNDRLRDTNVKIEGWTVTADSTGSNGGRLTTVELFLNNQSTRARAEYATEFTLPDGVLVTDYWLDIEGRIEHGILAERRAATWVYNEIVGSNRDPGFLRYVDPNTLALNVFPFSAQQTRRTAITFWHKDPFTLNIDNQEIKIAGESVTEPITLPDGSIYLSVKAKGALPQVQRKVSVHYLVDASRAFPEAEAEMVARIRNHHAKLPAGTPKPRLTLVNAYPQTLDWDSDWETALAETPAGGKFFRRALEDIILTDLSNPSEVAYQKITVSPELAGDVYVDRLNGANLANPEGLRMYPLRSDSSLRNRGDMPELDTSRSVRKYVAPSGKTYYLADDGQPTLLPNLTGESPSIANQQNVNWSTATALYAHHLANQINRETGYRPWLNEVQTSFKTGVMLPTTAFISLENEAQKEALRRKQADVLSADPSLDLEEIGDARRMSEPWWVWVPALFLFLVFSWRRRG